MASISIEHPTDRPNFSIVTVGNLSIGFSYKTPVAYQVGFSPWVVSENLWGPTTGKHINYFSKDKDNRLNRDAFEAALDNVKDLV